MVTGVGVDMIEVSRIAELWERKGERLAGRIFTSREIEASRGRHESLAGRFAAKEAVAKAFGTGVRGFSWNEVEIVEDENGRPLVVLSGRARDIASRLGIDRVLVSITHLADLACAVAIATGGGDVEGRAAR
ncbi:MAG TPA: holo-ACP synthase [Firmicutes bacterium]|nr:holo-ACP synthase [Bacillota bacterium]